MNTVIQATNVELDAPTRRALNSQLLRDLSRYAKDVELATAYVSSDSPEVANCRIAVMTKTGKRLSAEGKSVTHAEAMNQAGTQMAAALQREQNQTRDPRLNRGGRH